MQKKYMFDRSNKYCFVVIEAKGQTVEFFGSTGVKQAIEWTNFAGYGLKNVDQVNTVKNHYSTCLM